MEQEPNCLKHCNAACCRTAKYSTFLVEEKERIKLGITFAPCSLLTPEGKCSDYENRFQACQAFTSGSKDCLRFRAENPQYVIELTEADIDFQNWYFLALQMKTKQL